LIITLYVQTVNSACIRQTGADHEKFWFEMEFAQWFLIRTLWEFYDSPRLLPEVLAALYMDKEFIGRYISNNQAVIEQPNLFMSKYRNFQKDSRILPSVDESGNSDGSETPETGKERETMLNAIHSSILQRPVILNQELTKESEKFIRSGFPECRMEYKGFGRFLGYSDLNRIVFWSPFLLLRYFYLRYCGHGEEITAILTALPRMAGTSYAKREITEDHQRELASAVIQSLRKKYARS
jgi:hypothetical protein